MERRMDPESEGARRPLTHTRQVTIDALCDHFANDAMEVEEFERRVEAAHRAATVDDLTALLRDLPGGNLPAPSQGTESSDIAKHKFRVTSAAHVREREIIVAILGGASRRGRWSAARHNFGLAIMGGAELDFREAELGPGVTEVRVLAVWGGVEIIVPPGMNVECRGIGIMGGFDNYSDQDSDQASLDPDAPTLRITGLACMGGVEVTQRYPGESSREARRRRRSARKESRRLKRGD